MSKAKQNSFLTGYFAILAAGAAGLGYLAWSSSSAITEAEEKYTTTKAKLLALQKAPIFPKQDNVEAKKTQVDAYAAKVGERCPLLVLGWCQRTRRLRRCGRWSWFSH